MQLPSTYKLNFAFIVLLIAVVFAGCKSKQPAVVSENFEPTILAQPEVSRFTQNQQMTIDNAFLEGMKHLIIENYGTALDIFFEVLRMDNQHAPANFQISKIRLLQNQFNDAEIHAERAWRLSPNNRFYLLHLAEIYTHNHKFQQALNSYQRLIQLDPQNSDGYLLEMANLYLALRRPADAVRVLDSIEKRHGVSEELSMHKIRIFQAAGQETSIRNELQKLIQKFPNEPRYWAVLAELNMQTNRQKEAYENYQKILSLDPTDPYVHLSLADYYRATSDTVKVFEHLILALENPRLDIDFKVALTIPFYQILSETGNTYKMLDAILSAHPNDPKAFALYADFLQRDDRFLEAQEKYRKVTSLDASRYPVWEALLFCNLALLDAEGLLQDAEAALEIFPEQPIIYYMLGTAYNIKKDYVMAMQYLEQTVSLAQTNRGLLMMAHSSLGDVYHFLGNHRKSDENFRKALEIDPNNDITLNNFAYFLSLRGENLEEAEEMSRAVVQRNPTNPTFLDTFAWVLYKQGRYEEAKAIMDLALQNGGEGEAVLLEHYGDILWKVGEKKRALEYWKKAQALDSSDVSEFLNQKIKNQTLIEN